MDYQPRPLYPTVVKKFAQDHKIPPGFWFPLTKWLSAESSPVSLRPMPSAAEGCRHLHPRACQAFVRYSSALSRRVTHYLPLHRKPSTLTSSFVTSARHRIINYPVFSPFGAIVGKLGLNPAIWKFPSTFKSLFSAFPHLTDF